MIKSLLITVGVSTLFAFGVADYVNFWNAFAFVTGLQFVTFWLINSHQRADKDGIYSEFESNMDSVLALSHALLFCLLIHLKLLVKRNFYIIRYEQSYDV